MAIWFEPLTLSFLNQRGENTLAEFLGISFTEIGEDFLCADMLVTAKTKQPLGIVHGGANVVLAETVASTAANMVVDIHKYYCVGLEINANHLKAVRAGVVKAVARPFHLGRTTQVWHIELFNEHAELTCISRMTAAVLARS